MDTFIKTEDNTSCECAKYMAHDQKSCVESCGNHQVGVYHEDVQATVCECEKYYTYASNDKCICKLLGIDGLTCVGACESD